MEDSYQVIVIGAGFAGIAAAKELGGKGVRVLLIDSNNYHQFQPLLYQVARWPRHRSACLPLPGPFGPSSGGFETFGS